MRVLMVALLLSSAGGIVSEMTPEVVAEAVTYGATSKEVKLLRVTGGPAECFVSTPFLRVARASNEAKRKYATYGAGDVTPEMVAPVVHVFCPSKPVTPGGNPKFGFATVKHVVLTGKGGTEPVQPLKVEAVPETYKNAMGAEYAADGMLAHFPLDALRPGRELHVIYDKKVSGMMSRCDDCRVELKDLKGLR